MSRIDDIIRDAVRDVINSSACDFKNWWKDEFETEVYFETKEDLEKLSDNDLEIAKCDWITWVLDGFVSETCNRLGIECEDTHSRHNEAMMEEIHDIVKDVLFEKISASSETERKTREKKALIEKLEKIKDIAHDDSEAERVSTHIWNKAIEECIYTVKSFDAKEEQNG